jgi:hypothetical protein
VKKSGYKDKRTLMKAYKPLIPSKHIIFICNWEKTDSINAVAQMIKESRPEISIWALIHDDMAKSLLDNTIYDSVLDIRNAGVIVGENLLSIDAMREVLSRDRFLDDTPVNHIFLQRQYHLMSDWLAPVENAVFVGEVSWASEELLLYYAKSRGWDYFTPSVARLIDRRWFLANGMSERDIVVPASKGTNLTDQSVKIAEGRPDYFELGISNLRIINRVKSLSLSNVKRLFNSSKKRRLLVAKFVYFIAKGFNWLKISSISSVKERSLVVFPFHVQPEASIDYLAPRLRDQYELVHRLVKSLPSDVTLAVKDHPGAIHEFDLIGKLRLLLNKKVMYLHDSIDIDEEFEKFHSSIVVTGSLGIQLSMKGVPGITLSPMFFNDHPMSRYLEIDDIPESFEPQIENMVSLRNAKNLRESNDQFLEFLKANSFPGYSFSTSQFGSVDPLFLNSLADELLLRANINDD